MEHDKKRKLILLAGALIVGVMFVTSYAAFGTNGSTQTSSTTVKQTTYPVFGSVNAIVNGYGSSITVTLLDGNASAKLNSTLAGLESNSTVTNFIPTGNGFVVYAPGNDPYAAQQAILAQLPDNSVAIQGTEIVGIPGTFTLYYYGTGIKIYTNITNFTVPAQPLARRGSNISVSVQALVMPNGYVYNKNIVVS